MGEITVGYRFRLGLHLAVSAGPVDALLEIRAGDRTVWDGQDYTYNNNVGRFRAPVWTPVGTKAPLTTNKSVWVVAPSVFGGDEREGGLLGMLDVMFGGATQPQNAYLKAQLKDEVPSFRGVFSVVWKGGTVSANNPYIKPWAFKLRRTVKGWQGDQPWNTATISITLPNNAGVAMNPAHIVYQCLTDNDWGMGYSPSIIDIPNFTAAAATFHAEGLGLCLKWTRQNTIEAFIQIIMDHAGALLVQDRRTGLFKIKPLRADYTPANLPLFDENNIIEIESFQRPALTDAVNEISVKFDDITTGKEGSVTVQNVANISSQGGIITQPKSYPGLPTAELATRVAMRDLKAVSTAVAKVKFSANRAASTLLPGDVIRLSWARLGITQLVLRVLQVNTGTLTDGTVQVDAVEDIFGLPSSSYAKQQGTGWVEPTGVPSAATHFVVREAPYWEIQREMGAAAAANIPATAGYMMASAAKPRSDHRDFALARQNGDVVEEIGRSPFAPVGFLKTAISYGTTTITLENTEGLARIDRETYAQIDDELVTLKEGDPETGVYVIDRGALGTVAAKHAAGARLLVIGLDSTFDKTERIAGENATVRILPTASQGQLPYGLASNIVLNFSGLAGKPYPPGRFLVDGQADPILTTKSPTMTWLGRNRLQQNLEGDSVGSITSEGGVTYSLEVRDISTLPGTNIDAPTGLTTLTYTPPVFYGQGRLRLTLWSTRGATASAQRHVRELDYKITRPNTLPEGLYNLNLVGNVLVGLRDSVGVNGQALLAINPTTFAQVGGAAIGVQGGRRADSYVTDGTHLYFSTAENVTTPALPNRVMKVNPASLTPGALLTPVAETVYTGSDALSPVCLGGGFLWVILNRRLLRKIDPATMAEVWTLDLLPLGFAACGSPCYLDGKIYFSHFISNVPYIARVDTTTGLVVGTNFAVSGQPTQLFAIFDTLLVRTTVDLRLYTASTGAFVRTYAGAGALEVRPSIYQDEGEIVFSAGSEVIFLNAASGQERRRIPVNGLWAASGVALRRIWWSLRPQVGGFVDTAGFVRSPLLDAPRTSLSTGIALTNRRFTAAAGLLAGPGRIPLPNLAADVLLHFDGTQGSTFMVDSGVYGRTTQRVVLSGTGPTLNTTNKRLGLSAFSVGPGNLGYLRVPSVSMTARWSIDFWIRFDAPFSTTALEPVMGFNRPGSSNNFYFYRENLEGRLVANSGGIQTAPLAVGTWYHIAYIQDGNYRWLYVNGLAAVNALDAGTTQLIDPSDFWVGALPANLVSSTDRGMNSGQIDELRIVQGNPIWTANFTPPTQPYPDLPDPALLLKFNGSEGSTNFIDSSLTNRAISRVSSSSSDAVITTSQSKFGGASGQFNTAGYLLANLPAIPGDFSIDGWIRPAVLTEMQIFGLNGAPWLIIWMGWQGAGYAYISTPSGPLASPGPVFAVDTWAHLALTRRGGTLRLFINGVLQASMTDATALPAMTWAIGHVPANNADPAYAFRGQLDEWRVVIGEGVWERNFVPRTEGYPPATTAQGSAQIEPVRDPYWNSVVLRAPFNGAQGSTIIGDASPLALVPSAPGGAALPGALTTADSVSGGACFAFSSTQQNPITWANSNLYLTETFTVEFWYKTTRPRTNLCFKEQYRSSGGPIAGREFIIGVEGTTHYVEVRQTSPANFAPDGWETVPNSATPGAWTHIALVRDGSVARFYVNGQLAWTGAASGGMGAELAVDNKNIMVGQCGSTDVGPLFIDDLRVTKGIARYNAAFQPPINQLPTE